MADIKLLKGCGYDTVGQRVKKNALYVMLRHFGLYSTINGE